MGNGYTVPAQDALDQLRQILQDARRRLRELEALDGSQIYNTVQDLRNLIDGLLNPTNITVTGTITAGTAFNSVATYSRNVTGSGSYRALWVNIDGQIGYVPSSRQFKTDVEDLILDAAMVERLRGVTYRYVSAVDNMGDKAPTEPGLIAEEVDATGLTWLVDYDENGKPFGVRYDKLALALLPMVQDHERRLTVAGL